MVQQNPLCCQSIDINTKNIWAFRVLWHLHSNWSLACKLPPYYRGSSSIMKWKEKLAFRITLLSGPNVKRILKHANNLLLYASLTCHSSWYVHQNLASFIYGAMWKLWGAFMFGIVCMNIWIVIWDCRKKSFNCIYYPDLIWYLSHGKRLVLRHSVEDKQFLFWNILSVINCVQCNIINMGLSFLYYWFSYLPNFA